MKKRNPFVLIKEYLIITFGLILYTGAWVVFLIPLHLVGGGITGVSVLISYASGFDPAISYFLMNLILLAVGVKVLGWGYGIKTIYGVVMSSVFLEILPRIITPEFIQAFTVNGPMVCALSGGVLAGIGMGICIWQGGGTGGTDILANIISHYRNISPGRIIMWCDILIIGSSLFVADDMNNSMSIRVVRVLYGYLLTAIASIAVDSVLNGSKKSVQYLIFSKQYELIADRITNEAHRGVTILDGEGWYSKQACKVLLIVARHTDSAVINRIIREIDKNAFISVGSVNGVYGQGFEIMKR